MKCTALLIASTLASLLAYAGNEAAIANVPRGPYVPPAARKPSADAPAGAALQAKVATRLAERFSAADALGAGTISRAQAQRAHWGYVAEHFDAIDVNRTGRVSLEDVKRYMRTKGAAL
jgi:hypothetical protein